MDKHLEQLEQVMRELIDEHEQLHGLVRRKIEAMRLARPVLVADCCRLENERVQRIAELEKRRQQLVGLITLIAAPGVAAPLSLMQIAERAAEPQRGRLLVLRQKLRQTMQDVRTDNDVARRATDGLLRHVTSMIGAVAAAVSGAGTYTPRGHSMMPAAAANSFTAMG